MGIRMMKPGCGMGAAILAGLSGCRGILLGCPGDAVGDAGAWGGGAYSAIWAPNDASSLAHMLHTLHTLTQTHTLDTHVTHLDTRRPFGHFRLTHKQRQLLISNYAISTRILKHPGASSNTSANSDTPPRCSNMLRHSPRNPQSKKIQRRSMQRCHI